MPCKRSNLVRLGIEDFVAIAFFIQRSGLSRHSDTKYSHKMFLSDLVNKHPDGLRNGRPKGNRQYMEEYDTLRVYALTNYEKGEELGYIFADGMFYYEGAKTIKEALGWYIASKLGDSDLPDDFNLNKVSEELLETIMSGGLSLHTYMFRFTEVIYRALTQALGNQDYPMLFLTASHFLWAAATRELGIEHPGYSISKGSVLWDVPRKY